MQKNWYVISVCPGYEHRTKKLLERKINLRKLDDCFSELLVPTEKVLEPVHGVKKIVARRMFPGYLLAQIALNDDVRRIIRTTPKVRGLMGEPDIPTVLSESEVKEILDRVHAAEAKPRTKTAFAAGDRIKITDGAFRDFTGTVNEFTPERGRIKVSVSVFGRPTPVVLDPVQVEAA